MAITLIENTERIPLHETVYAQRRKRALDGAESFLASAVQREISEAASRNAEADPKLRASYLAENFGVSPRKARRRHALEEAAAARKLISDRALIEVLSETFYDCIVLDEDYKQACSDSIVGTARRFFEECFKSGAVSEKSLLNCQCIPMREMAEGALAVTENAYAGVGYEGEEGVDLGSADPTQRAANSAERAQGATQSGIARVLEAAVEATAPQRDAIANEVQSKVVQVVKSERDIADRNAKDAQDALSEGFGFTRRSRPTLFRSLVVSNSKEIGGSGNGLSKELMSAAIAESIVQYTLLEMLNTVKISDMKPEETRTLAFGLSTSME